MNAYVYILMEHTEAEGHKVVEVFETPEQAAEEADRLHKVNTYIHYYMLGQPVTLKSALLARIEGKGSV